VEPLEIANRLEDRFPDDVIDITTFRDQTSVTVRSGRVVDLCRFLRDEPDLAMDYLADLCGVDHGERKPRFEVVYNLYSMRHRHRIRIKAGVEENDPTIASVVEIWKGADWYEREAFDMYGVSFDGHPDLRRLLMPEDWRGSPMRKDYPLKGLEDWEWPGYVEVMEMHESDDERSVK
jgi:NADH-quinone oxidoreductase subunit C